MNIFISTDTHFSHSSMVSKCRRPKDYEDKILNNWRSQIREDDWFIHLGDISFSNTEHEWHRRIFEIIKCKSCLVMGNHDKKSLEWYMRFGWDCVCDRLDLFRYGYNIVLSHRPLLIDGESINVHGHFHNNSYERCFEVEPNLKEIYTNRHIRLSIEENNYQLYTLAGIIKRYNHEKAQKIKNEENNKTTNSQST